MEPGGSAARIASAIGAGGSASSATHAAYTTFHVFFSGRATLSAAESSPAPPTFGVWVGQPSSVIQIGFSASPYFAMISGCE